MLFWGLKGLIYNSVVEFAGYNNIMTSLFILQLVCCVITAMLALQLAMASLQVRWKVWRYEISRWLLVASMLFFSVHYLLQMVHGLRAQGTDVGAAFNILFYTPVAFAITLSIINIESTGSKVRRYCLRSMMAYILIALVFVIGIFQNRSLHIGNMLYVMLGLFVASMAYFIFVIHKETNTQRQKLMENFGSDLIPYVRYSQASIILLYLTAGLLPVAILFNTLLYIIGPLMLLSVIFFVHTFIAMGYYITPKGVISDENDAEAKVTEAEDINDDKNTHSTNILTANRKMEIELALKKWCEEGCYKDYEVSIYSLATKLGYKKNELTEYFNQSEYTNFRTWLSDIRFNEAVRMMKANPEYSIDAISTECGFSSHTWIYRIFKQKTGMSPSQWRKQFASI